MVKNGRLERSIASLIAALIIAMALSIASASASVTQRPANMTVVHLNGSRSLAQSYWTARRMRTAPSRSLIALDGKPSPADASPVTPQLAAFRTGSITRSASAAAATPLDTSLYTTAPYSTSGRIFGTDATGSYSCSGTAVTSANRSVVWTAGHCVIDPETGNRATSIMFIPAYHSGNAPFGIWTAAEADVPPQWSQANGFPEGHDMAALVMNTDQSGQRLTDVVGGRDIEFDQSQQQTFDAFGYPAATPFNGASMYHCLSSVTRVDANTSPASLGISCDMTNGSSGGGWIVDGRYLNSNVTYFYKDHPGTLYGPYFGSVAASLFDEASNSTATGSLPSGSPTPPPSGDKVRPSLSGVYAKPATFSPNGDGQADVTKLHWTQSETATILLTIKNSSGRTVVKMVSRDPILAASWYAKWDGHDANGKLQKPGVYTFKLVATDVAGNVSKAAKSTVRITR